MCAAQNNKFVDEHTASEMCQTPTDAVPPLLEVAARAVLDHDLHWDSPSLPTSLRGDIITSGLSRYINIYVNVKNDTLMYTALSATFCSY